MSDTILGGDFTVYYRSENRQKRIKYTGSGSTYSVNQLYSALLDLFDELNQMDDGTPISAQTPTEYTVGIIDSGDSEAWFIDRESVEYLYGGAIKTASWARVEGSNNGIVLIANVSSNNIVVGDIGEDITHGDGDSGTLLDVQGNYLWIRPDSTSSDDSFDATTGTLTCNGNTATQTEASKTGESLWANIYSIGTIESNTHLYLNQNGVLLTGYKSATDWWSDGHIDILVNVKEVSTEADDAVIQVLARKFSAVYDYYEVDLTSGGRNPIPLATSVDLDNQEGYREMDGLSVTGGPFTVGEIIEDDGDDTIQGIVTFQDTDTLRYYLIGDPLTDFSVATGQFTGQSSSAFANAVDPTNVGPANLTTPPTIVHTARDVDDIDEDGTAEPYSINIDVNQNTLSDMWGWLKYITRRGEAGTGNTDGVGGQFYIGTQLQVEYTGQAGGAWTEGNIVYLVDTDNSSGLGVNSTIAYGVVVADHDDGATGDLLIRTIRSYAALTHVEKVWDAASTPTVTADYASSRVVTPTKQSPFGTFAGGVFFGAEGVVLTDYKATDANNFQLKDDDGNVVTAPNKVSVVVSNTRLGDKIALFRLTGTGGDIKKDDYACTTQSGESTTLIAGSTISPEAPGKATGGIVRIVSTTAQEEYRLRYTSWAGSTFTLYTDTGTATGGDSNTLIDNGATFSGSVLVGDLVRNKTEDVVAYVTEVVSDTTLETTVVSSWSGDEYYIGHLPTSVSGGDTIYVPFIDIYETAGTSANPGDASVNVTYSVSIPTRIRVRNAGDIIPFETDGAIGSTGLAVATIRTSDTIYT